MLDAPTVHHLSAAINNANLVTLCCPVNPDKPAILFRHNDLLSPSLVREAASSLYWRSRRELPTGRASRNLTDGVHLLRRCCVTGAPWHSRLCGRDPLLVSQFGTHFKRIGSAAIVRNVRTPRAQRFCRYSGHQKV